MNSRAPRMWEIVGPSYDWRGKTVLDVGCGGGDMLLYAEDAGAIVIGVDEDPGPAIGRGLTAVSSDLNEFIEDTPGGWDVIFCFSVLPYVDMDRTLDNIAEKAHTSFIECQYLGDGPGKVEGREEMRQILSERWPLVERLGHTEVKIRDTVRDIWRCE